jgi:hypothetical protein
LQFGIDKNSIDFDLKRTVPGKDNILIPNLIVVVMGQLSDPLLPILQLIVLGDLILRDMDIAITRFDL